MYMPTFPLTVRVPRVRSSFVGHSIIPISYPRNRALPVWAWVISVFSADRVSCSSVASNVDILSLICWAFTKWPANPRRKSSAYLTYRNLLYPGSSGFWEGYRFIALHRALILSRFPCRRAVASWLLSCPYMGCSSLLSLWVCSGQYLRQLGKAEGGLRGMNPPQ